METLVLSPSFEPVDIVPWERAITLWFEGKAEIIEHGDKAIRSINFEMPVPSIIRFLKAGKSNKRAIKFSRENVYERDNARCQYCNRKVGRHEATYDHVHPRSQGGQTTWLNVVICCVPCNQRKGGRTPEQAGMKLLSVPTKPKKLSDKMRFCLTWNDRYPEVWKQWLKIDVPYWHSELESDN
jgi:5-methylcytosine-specific restriction endonuclease McrA